MILETDVTAKQLLVEIEHLKARISELEALLDDRNIELDGKNKELDNAIRVFAGRELIVRELRRIIVKLKETQ